MMGKIGNFPIISNGSCRIMQQILCWCHDTIFSGTVVSRWLMPRVLDFWALLFESVLIAISFAFLLDDFSRQRRSTLLLWRWRQRRIAPLPPPPQKRGANATGMRTLGRELPPIMMAIKRYLNT